MKTKKLDAEKEFKKGANGIGWMNSTFEKYCKGKKFESTPVFSYQKLPRSMNDSEIESELKPEVSSLSTIHAFMQNPPEGTKDGWANLFYFPEFVVGVGWCSGLGGWGVFAWQRGGSRWIVENRVFSPAKFSETLGSALESSEPMTLPDILEINGIKYKKV